MSLGKVDIIKSIKAKTQLSNKESFKLFESFILLIKNTVNSHSVKIANFGAFQTKISPERLGRNPKTNMTYPIIARKKISFNPSSTIKNLIN